MTTFSQLIDSILDERSRPDLLTAAPAWLNQSIRLLHARPNIAGPALYDANRVEVSFTPTGSAPYLWTLPNPTRFQFLEAMHAKNLDEYIPQKRPAISKHDGPENLLPELFWYRTGPQIAISGVDTSETVNISYFEFPRKLKYKADADRVVTYDEDTDAYTLIDGGGTPTQEQLDLETNWMLQRWEHVLREGVLAHLYKNLGDTERGRMSYSSFESGRLQVFQTEPMTGLPS